MPDRHATEAPTEPVDTDCPDNTRLVDHHPPMIATGNRKEIAMAEIRNPAVAASPVLAAQGRQILFYAPDGLLGGTLTCSRCGGSGRQPDMIEHDRDCSYDRSAPPPSADDPAPGAADRVPRSAPVTPR
ncbi:MAG: hypothetical protein ABI460_11455 [Caldimonas sp.]